MRRFGWLAIATACHARSPSPALAPPPEERRLLAARDRDDVATMRAHAWGVIDRVLREWQRWERSDVVFGRPDRVYRKLQPFEHHGRLVHEALPMMFQVVLDPVAAAHVRAERLARRDRLHELRAVPGFPREAIALKPLWYPVHAQGVTELPVWDGDEPGPDGNPAASWSRRVAIDASRLDDFIHRELSGAELAAARRQDPTLGAGDHLVLLGLHVSTKEIPDWVWATLWWHDRPDDGRFARGRPAALGGAARHYLMDATFGPDGTCMNPYLEARFPDGTRSNCAACHQRAAFGARNYLPVTRGATPADDVYFAGKVTTDFMWSIALEAR